VTATLDVLNQRLSVALHDQTYDVWDTEEMDTLITDAVAGLWPRLSRELPYSTSTITLVAGTYVYSAPTGALAISRIDWVSTASDELGPLANGNWEQVGDPLAGALKVHVSPTIADTGGTLRCVCYGRYDLTTNTVPNDYVPLVLAVARAEAYRRIASSRVRFQQWSGAEQVADTSINELMQMINEADSEAMLQRRLRRTWQRPVPARTG